MANIVRWTLNGGDGMLITPPRLREDSIVVSNGTTVYHPETKTDDKLFCIDETLKRFEGRRVHCVENGVLAFISNEEFFVTPFTGKKLRFLVEQEKSERENFFVPFADGSVPKEFFGLWQKLLDDAEDPG